MLNSIGLQNIGVEAVVSEKAPIWATWTVPVLVNVSGTSVEDYVDVVSRLEGVSGISGIELNISCPNVREGGVQFGVDARLAHQVTEAARSSTSLPVVVKLSPNVTDIRVIASAVESAGADAISLINTVYGLAIDCDRRAPILGNTWGGLSGPAIKPLALYLVHQVAQVVSVPIIGIGGIMTSEDAVEFLLAGASAIQMGTALMLNPSSWRDVAFGIDQWCSQQGVKDPREVVGAANAGFKGSAVKEETGALHVAGS
jgi:dihydroorotate dehydrogenase (NAD+) catalytic subunit